MGLMSEFKAFAMRGNVVDLAVGVIIGAAFGKIVDSLVNNVIMPPIGWLTGGIDFKDKALLLADKGGDGKPVLLQYGVFINAIISFLIVAFCLFLLIKAINRLTAKPAAPAGPPPPTKEEVLLTEIRDALRAMKA